MSEFRYQWLRDGVAVGSGVTYQVTGADRGHTIWCVVTAIGAGGRAEAQSFNSLLIEGGTTPWLITAPEVSGTPAVGETLSCSTGTWGGTPAPTFTYQWSRDGSVISSATASKYVVTEADQGRSLRCKVTASNSAGSNSASSNTVQVTGTKPSPAVAPQVLGIEPASVGESLTCSPGTWNGSPPPAFAYRWVRDPGLPGETLVGSAINSIYTVRAEDQLHSLACRVTATNSAGSAEALSANSIVVRGSPPRNSVPPAIRGFLEVGIKLTCEAGIWTGVPTPTYSYLWVRDRGMPEELALTTLTSYTPTFEDRGHSFVCIVTAQNTEGHASESSEVVVVPAPGGSKPQNTVAPEISGTPALGQVLGCSSGTWTGNPAPVFSYQWLRDGSVIASATETSYVVAEGDQAHALSCKVTAVNEAGIASKTSASVEIPGSQPENVNPPEVFGAAGVGQQLACLRGTWKGQPPPTFAYRWLRDGVEIASATANTYTVADEDRGTSIACRVTATNSVGSASELSLNSRAIPGTAPVNTAPPEVTGTPAAGETLRCLPGTWSGKPRPTFAYQWQLNGTDVPGAAQETFAISQADRGFDITCQVTASNREGSAAAFSNAAHVPGEKPELLEAPQVSTGLGTPPVEEATVGQRLTCAPGRWKGQPPPQFTYLWLSDGVSIPSATGSVYSAEPTDLNHVLSCIVTATNGEGSASAESSNDTVIRRKPVKNELPRELAIPPLEVAPPPTTVQIRTGLRVQLARAMHHVHLASLRKTGVFAFPFATLAPGTLEVFWYQAPAQGNWRAVTGKSVLLARSSLRFTSAGTRTVKLRLTSAGRSVIAQHKRIPLTVNGVFLPSQERRVLWQLWYLLSH